MPEKPEKEWFDRPVLIAFMLITLPLIALVGLVFNRSFPPPLRILLIAVAIVSFAGQIALTWLILKEG